MSEREALILLSTFIPFGPARIGLLLEYFGSAKKVLNATRRELLKVGLKDLLVDKFISHRLNLKAEEYFDRLNKVGIKVITFKDKLYPKNLKNLEGKPTVLYVFGTPEILSERSVAIVGSRKMTSYGREVTENFVEGLVSSGIVIISGLARGVDTIAHNSTIKFGGKTIAVLGQGLHSIYPPENTWLAKEIIKKGGAVISEYPLGYPSIPANFPNRNRIVSGLADALLVVEGESRSGTLLTAAHAADQNKSVFAIPGQVTSPLSAAPLYLIKNGAKIALGPEDILDELGWQNIFERKDVEKVAPSDKIEEEILKIIENEALHLDEVARISSLDTNVISARLTIMEIKGLVKNMGGGVFRKV